MRGIAPALLVIALAACGASPAAVRSPPENDGARLAATLRARVQWPSALLVAEHEGETFFRHRNRPRGYAWVEPGMVLAVRGGVSDGRARAATDGPLRIRGWIDVTSIGGVVLRRGRVRGTPLYLGPGDHVRFVDADGGTARVEVAARFGHPLTPESQAFIGNMPIVRIGAVMFGRGTGPTPGRPGLIHRATTLRARPQGDPVYSIPALDPPLGVTVLREHGDWIGVRVGIGPYLVGYVLASSMRPDASAHKDVGNPEVLDPWARPGSPSRQVRPPVANPWARDAESDEAEDEEDALPPRLRSAVVRPVRAVRAGTRVSVEGMVVAVFRLPGWAVELERRGGEVEILGAIDERATVRGMVPSGALFEP